MGDLLLSAGLRSSALQTALLLAWISSGFKVEGPLSGIASCTVKSKAADE